MGALKSSRERTHSLYNLVENVHTLISTRCTHIQHTFIQTMNKQINSIGFTIKYQNPYPPIGLVEEWRTKSFSTLEQAERMIEFYKSCEIGRAHV